MPNRFPGLASGDQEFIGFGCLCGNLSPQLPRLVCGVKVVASYLAAGAFTLQCVRHATTRH